MLKINKKTIKHSFDEYGDFKTVPENLLHFYLSEDIKIAKDVTFGRIFELLIIHKELFNSIFYGKMRGFKIDEFIDDFNKEPVNTEITYLKIYRLMNKWGSDYFDDYICFDGIAKNYIDKNFNNAKPFNCNFSLSFASINSLKNLEIRCINDFKITDSTKNSKGHIVLINEKKPFTLFEFIGAILYEITWFGTPEQKQEKASELNKIIENIDSGKEETFELKFENDELHSVDKKGNKKKLYNDTNTKIRK
jgi:hypothetical protein